MKTKRISNRLLAVLAGTYSFPMLLLWPLSVAGQAQISFNNRITGVVIAPIYGVELLDPLRCKQGNTPSGFPPGTQTYGGPSLVGAGYTAELWIAPGGMPEESLVPMTPSTTFQTTPALAGFVIPVTVTVPGIPAGSAIMLQMRVWDNLGGIVVNWAQVQSLPTVPRGKSQLWVVTVPSGTPPPATSPMAGLRSFNLCLPPQPPTIVTQPVSQVISPGAPASFSVVATGAGTLHYLWKLGGAPIQGAPDAAIYSIPHAGPEHVGTYTVTVTDNVGSTDSRPATLSLQDLHVCAVITINGPVGTEYRIEYSPEMAAPPVWSWLATVTLQTAPLHYIDWGCSGAARRYYRVVQLMP